MIVGVVVPVGAEEDSKRWDNALKSIQLCDQGDVDVRIIQVIRSDAKYVVWTDRDKDEWIRFQVKDDSIITVAEQVKTGYDRLEKMGVDLIVPFSANDIMFPSALLDFVSAAKRYPKKKVFYGNYVTMNERMELGQLAKSKDVSQWGDGWKYFKNNNVMSDVTAIRPSVLKDVPCPDQYGAHSLRVFYLQLLSRFGKEVFSYIDRITHAWIDGEGKSPHPQLSYQDKWREESWVTFDKFIREWKMEKREVVCA